VTRFVIGMVALGAAMFLGGPAAVSAAAEGENMIVNGDFTADTDNDGLADGWQIEEQGGLKIRPSRETGPEGGQAQVITARREEGDPYHGHAMLLQQDTFALRKDQWYKVTFQVRGTIPGSSASIAIRQTDPWGELGLSRQFRLHRDWQPREFLFRATRDISEHIRLQIWFTQPGTLSIANVQIVEAEAREAQRHYVEAVPATEAKNLVPNGSFECGTSGWGSIGPGAGWGMNSLTSLFGHLDTEMPAQGKHSFRIDLDKAAAPVVAFDYFNVEAIPVHYVLVGNRGWISVEPGKPYTLSASVRAASAGTPGLLSVHEAFAGEQTKPFTATKEWQRVTFTFTPQADQVYVGVGPDLRKSDQQKATVWVDAVQCERGEQATDYEPHAALEVGLTWAQPGHLFDSPAEARAIITAANAGHGEQRVRVRATVTDFFDKVVARPEVTLRVPAGGGAAQELDLGVRDKGYYQLRLEAPGATVLPLLAERFAVIDFPRAADGYFGMNHAYSDEETVKLSRDIGLSWFRDWSLKWHQVEPEKGTFDFAPMDFQIERVRRQRLDVIGLLPFPSSKWASTAPPDATSSHDMRENAWAAYMPRDLDEFADYVRATVRHYKGRIHIWEILNEPLYTGYALPRRNGYTVEDYVSVLKTAYQTIKGVQPEATVIGGIAADPETLASEFIGAGGLDWVDMLNIHIYPVFQLPEAYLPRLAELNARMQEAGKAKPLAYTEGSYYGDDDLPFLPYRAGDNLMQPLESELECASYQARFDLILLAQNTKFVIYHAGSGGALNSPAVGGVFFEWDGAPRKMAITQSVMSHLFGRDTTYLGSVWDKARSFAFHSRGRTIVAVWDEQEQGLAVTAPAGPQVLNLAGGTVKEKRIALGETPYYLVFDGSLSLPVLQERLEGCLGGS
jgi:hypothetical protein